MGAGWVPVAEGGTSGNLPGSHFSVRNLRIKGSVVQGPEPARCSPAPSPPSPSPPSPSPSPPLRPGRWQPCSGGHCCDPHSAVPQFCPGHIPCEDCGADACQCPKGST